MRCGPPVMRAQVSLCRPQPKRVCACGPTPRRRNGQSDPSGSDHCSRAFGRWFQVVQGDPVAGSRGHALPARPPGGRRRWAAKAARAPRARTTSRRRAGRLTRRPARACPNPTLTPGSAARRAQPVWHLPGGDRHRGVLRRPRPLLATGHPGARPGRTLVLDACAAPLREQVRDISIMFASSAQPACQAL